MLKAQSFQAVSGYSPWAYFAHGRFCPTTITFSKYVHQQVNAVDKNLREKFVYANYFDHVRSIMHLRS